MRMLNGIGSWLQTGVHDAWLWVAALSLQEWFLFLGLASAAGFLCMRGYGSRGNY
jgi:hypothetical protein